MKRFLLSITLYMLAFAGIQAEEVTGNAATTFGSATTNVTEFIVDPVTLTFSKADGNTAPAYNKSGDCRIYAKNTITATCSTGNLTKIVFTVSAQGKKRLTDLTPSTGTVTIADDHSTITWEGNATEIVMTVGEKAVYGTDGDTKAGQICFTEFTATYSTDGGTVTPTPDPEEPDGGEGEGEGEGETTYLTIAEVLAAGAGEATTKGTVVATYARGFLMNDGTGSILVYLNSAPSVTAGDAVNVSGTTSMYGGLLQFAAGSTVEKTGTATVNHPTATVMDGAAMDAYLTAPAIQYVEYTGTLTVNGNYYNVAVEGATTAIGSIQYPNTGLVTAASGDVVKVTGYTIGVSSNKYVNTMAVKVEAVEDSGNEGEGEGNELEVTEIAEIIEAGAGQAKAQGTIVATYGRGFLLDDGTGSILVYLGSDGGNAVGEIVTVEGTTSLYGGLLQFAAGSVVTKLTTTTVSYPTATTMDGAAMDAYLTAPAIQYVEYTGTLTVNSNYYNVAVEGAATAIGSIQYPQDAIKANLTNGAVVKVTGYTIGVSSSKYVNTMAVKVEVVSEGSGEGEDEGEEPVETKSYTVTEALAAYVDGQQIPAIVTGYIVGAVNSAPETGSQFGTDATIATNILISDNPDTNDYTECLIVQLPSGDIRSALNLVDNPSNYKKQVKITGSIEKYFKVAGLKSVTAYELTGVTGIIDVIGESNAVKTIFDITGRRIDNITRPGIYIVNGKKVLVK